jgi:hypothetical protein
MEGWSEKYKRSINCSNPKGFSQKAHCAGRKKNEDIDMTMDLNKALDTLEPRLKDVVLMRVKYNMTFKEIGKEIGTGKERARQVYERALRKLRHHSRGITEPKDLEEFDQAAAREKAKAANQARIKQDAERSQNRKDIRDKLKNIKRTV